MKFDEIINKKFGRLTPTSEFETINNRKKYICICDCGSIIKTALYMLTSGKTKSCGCLRKEVSKLRAIKNNSKCDPKLSSAKVAFRKNGYNDGNITFEDFYKLSQLNCYYCGALPNNKTNDFPFCKKSSKISIKNGDFIYNGLDRIDNNLSHVKGNLVSCCKYCNYAKRNRSLKDFYNWINNLEIKNYNYKFINHKINLTNKEFREAKSIWKNYKDGMTFENFLSMSQEKCFYCNELPQNINKNFKYNGLDRIDSDKDHSLENVVPCCKHCNYAKRERNTDEFYLWILNLKTFYKL